MFFPVVCTSPCWTSRTGWWTPGRPFELVVLLHAHHLAHGAEPRAVEVDAVARLDERAAVERVVVGDGVLRFEAADLAVGGHSGRPGTSACRVAAVGKVFVLRPGLGDARRGPRPSRPRKAAESRSRRILPGIAGRRRTGVGRVGQGRGGAARLSGRAARRLLDPAARARPPTSTMPRQVVRLCFSMDIRFARPLAAGVLLPRKPGRKRPG